MAAMNEELRAFLLTNVYRNFRITRTCRTRQSGRWSPSSTPWRVRPSSSPPGADAHIAEDGLARAICDYLAGLTDREAVAEHRRLFDVGQAA